MLNIAYYYIHFRHQPLKDQINSCYVVAKPLFDVLPKKDHKHAAEQYTRGKGSLNRALNR